MTCEVADVAPPNRVPEALGDGTLTAHTTAEGAARSFFITTFFCDADGDQPTYRIEGPDFVGFSGGGGLRIAPEKGDDGELECDPLVFDLFAPDAIQEDPYPQTGAAVRLEAGDALTAGADGSNAWGAGVALTGYGREGALAEVVFSTQFSDHGFGVADEGGRWGGRIDFADPVDSLTFEIGMPELTEGRSGFEETGVWIARDAVGDAIADGLIGPEQSGLGPDVKLDGGYVICPIATRGDIVSQAEPNDAAPTRREV